MSDKTKRDMMGSRADMISGKFDEVSRNSIWRECMKRERAAVRGSSEFTLNPATRACGAAAAARWRVARGAAICWVGVLCG